MSTIEDVARDVLDVSSLPRNHETLVRRVLKTMEELGEVSEALLSVTSTNNGKDKTWDDVKEEAVDVLLMIFDILATPMPGDEGKTEGEVFNDALEQFASMKLAKWNKQVLAGNDLIG